MCVYVSRIKPIEAKVINKYNKNKKELFFSVNWSGKQLEKSRLLLYGFRERKKNSDYRDVCSISSK